MSELFELDPAEELGAGAIGDPGERAFYLQARKESAQLTVLVEKQQIALLATEAGAFLDQIDADYPDDDAPDEAIPGLDAPTTELLAKTSDIGSLQEPAVPLFRARAIGIGFDPERSMILLEFREHGRVDDDAAGEEFGADLDDDANDEDDGEAHRDIDEMFDTERGEGWVARIYASRTQVRAMLASGAAAVIAGRPMCPLCDFPMDPDGHQCPRLN